MLPLIINAQDWGSETVLNPSFANDNRFNKTLDLSGNQNQTPDVPEWTQDLILYQIRIDKFGVLPTINSAREKLSVLEELGVTGVVLNPVAQPFKWPDGNHEEWSYYTHLEPEIIDPDLGTEADFQALIDDLHSMGIKVFLDFEFHGVFDRNVFLQGKYDVNQAAYDAAGPESVSSLITDHPEFFETVTDDKGTHIRYTDWNSAELMWKYTNGTVNTSLVNWFKAVLKDKWLIKYNLDGLRLDLEPYEVANVVGYSFWSDLIAQVKNETGRTVVLIPEDGNADTQNAFAFAQENFGVDNPRVGAGSWSHVKDFMVSKYIYADYPIPVDKPGYKNTVYPVNIVDEVKDMDGDSYSRKETYYSSCISSHDKHEYPSQGHLVYFGYGMMFQPFIPFWFMGNEFDVRKTVPYGNGSIDVNNFFDIIYFSRINWDDYNTNKNHFNEVRKMVYIRKKYNNLIGPSTHRLKDKAMVKVGIIGNQTDLPAYGYYNTGNEKVGIVVIGTKENSVDNTTIKIPLSEMNLEGYSSYEFHNLLDDTKEIKTPVDGTSDEFKVENLEAWGNLIYKIEPVGDMAIGDNKLIKFEMFPNPVLEQLTIKTIKLSSISEIEIFDTSGKTVIKKLVDDNKVIINTSSLEKGVYFIKIKTDDGIGFEQLLKM